MTTEQPTPPAVVLSTAQLKGTYVTQGGVIENFTPRINGKMFRCRCGCNIFSKPNDQDLALYECNGCGALYESE